jgi:hypothetical protein
MLYCTYLSRRVISRFMEGWLGERHLNKEKKRLYVSTSIQLMDGREAE